MHTNREEYIAAQCIFNNGYTLRQYADKYGEGEYVEYDMKFYDEDANPAVYTPGVKWGDSTSDKLADLYQMIRMLITVGNAATEVLLGSDAAEALLDDEKLPNRRHRARGSAPGCRSLGPPERARAYDRPADL